MSGNNHFDLEWRVTGLYEFDGQETFVEEEIDVEEGPVNTDVQPTVGQRLRNVTQQARTAAVEAEHRALPFLERAANNTRNFARNRFNDMVNAATFVANLTIGFGKSIIDIVGKIDYLSLKLLALVEAAVLVVGGILPLVALGIINKVTGIGGDFASSSFAKARAMAENNIKIATVGMLASQVVSFLELATAARYMSVVASALPAVARVVVAAAATIWHDKINRAMQTVGSKLGLTNPPAAAPQISDQEHRENIAQFVGSSAALAATQAAVTYGTPAVATAAATALSGLVAPVAIAALGANVGFYAYDKYRSMPSNDTTTNAAPGATAPTDGTQPGVAVVGGNDNVPLVQQQQEVARPTMGT